MHYLASTWVAAVYFENSEALAKVIVSSQTQVSIFSEKVGRLRLSESRRERATVHTSVLLGRRVEEENASNVFFSKKIFN